MSSRRPLFREVNRRIRDVNASFGPESPSHEILICECGREGCAERLEVPRDVYEVIFRDAAQRFLVAPGHEEPSQEQVVAGAPTYLVVTPRPEAI